MRKEQVLILYENRLFAEGLQSILRKDRVLKITGVLSQRENGRRQIKSMRPDVVIIEGSDTLVDASSMLRELLEYNTKGRVISVNLNRKNAVVCIGYKLAATELNLINAVKNHLHGGLARSIG